MNRAQARTFILDAVAVHRLTRLATADVVFAEPRAWLIRRSYERQADNEAKSLNAHLHGRLEPFAAARPSDLTPVEWAQLAIDDDNAPKVAALITCRWCSSTWIAVAVVIARRFVPRWWDPVARGAALSSVATLLARVED